VQANSTEGQGSRRAVAPSDDDDDDDDHHHHLLCCVRIRYLRVNVYSARVILVNHNLEVSVRKNILTVNIKVIFRIKRESIFLIIQSVHPSIHPSVSVLKAD
jgi:hypothetical protein